MERWRRNFIIIAGFLEALVFSGCLFGWPSLLFILQEEGVYRNLCNFNTFPIVTGTDSNELNSFRPLSYENTYQPTESHYVRNEHGCDGPCNYDPSKNLTSELRTSGRGRFTDEASFGCDEQRVYMTLIYTFAAVAYGITAVFIGFSLEILGLVYTRLIGSAFGCAGFALLAFTTSQRSYLLWPALNLIALGTNQLRLSGFQFANLWPQYRATILTTYSSAYAISTTLFLGVQLFYELGVPIRLLCLCCGGLCVLTFIPTCFMPSLRIDEEKTTSQPSSEQNENAEKLLQQDKIDIELNSGNGSDMKPNAASPNDTTKESLNPTSYWDSLFSISGGLHTYWHFINLFLVLFYSSTFNIWIAHVTDDIHQVSFYIKMSGIFCLIAPVFIPISGYVTDMMIRRAEKLSDPVEQLAYTMQAPTFAMAGATILLACTMICKLFFTETAVYASLVLIAWTRPAVVGSCTAYIRLRFPGEHFNILNGIFTTVISVLCFLQYPIMKWMTTSHQGYLQVHWLLLLSLLVSLSSPCHMMLRPNIMYFAKTRLHSE